MKDIVAREITWRSYMYHWEKFVSARPSLAPCVRPFAAKEMSMTELAASKVFWSMSKAEVIHACRSMGHAVPEAVSLFEVLSVAVSSVVACDEERALKVLSQRRIDSELCNHYSEVISGIDMAQEVLEMHHRDLAAREKVSATNRLDARSEYRAQYKEAMTSFRLAKENKTQRAKTTGFSRGTLPTEISQQEAKKFIPPACSIWRGRVAGNWQGERQPFASVYESWTNTSEPIAMRRVVRQLWGQYLMREGKDRSECPWASMWDETAELGA